MEREDVTFIPGLFRGSNGKKHVKADDPFITQEALHSYCSIFSPDGIPNNIRDDPYVAEITNFSEECLNNIAQFQIQRAEGETGPEKECEKQKSEDQKGKKTLDRQVDKIFQENFCFLKKQCPVKIPYKSSLTHEQHAAYLRTFIKFKMRPTMTAADTAEYEQYLGLQHHVYEEQKKFMEFSYQVARLELETYNTVPQAITKFIDDYVKHRSKRAAKYEEHYVTEQHVPICPQDQEKYLSSMSLSHLGHLLSLGTVPQFFIPHKRKQHILTVDDSTSKMDLMAQSVVPDKSILNNTPVSADHNAEYLANQHRANIVISTSAMKVLTDNPGPNFDKEWDIPVKVKSYAVEDQEGRQTQHRVAYVDKPMPKKNWTPLEKKQLYFKKVALRKFTKLNENKFFRMETFQYSQADKDNTNVASRSVTQYDDDFLNLSDTTDSHVFGDEHIESISIKSKKKKKNKAQLDESRTKATKLETDKPSATKNNDEDIKEYLDNSVKTVTLIPALEKSGEVDSKHSTSAPGASEEDSEEKKDTIEHPANNTQDHRDQENILEGLLAMQDSLLKPFQKQSVAVKMGSKNATLASGKPSKKMFANRLNTNWKNFFEPQNCLQGTGKNVHYHLFSLGSDSCQPSSSLQPIRILVRSNLHGINKKNAYIIYPKVESQAYFGCEVNTPSEITQQWIQLLVRPETSLLQVRVCESSGEILMTEERDLNTVLKEGKQLHVAFSPQQPLATLYSVLTALLGHPSGHYILHHDCKTKAFIQLMKAANPKREEHLNIYNFHKAYAAPSVNTRKYTVPPWLAIDTHVLSPFHIYHKKIPGTFPMNNSKRKCTLTKRQGKKKSKNFQVKKSLQDLDKKKKEPSLS